MPSDMLSWAKFIHRQDDTNKVKSKGSRDDMVSHTANKHKHREAVINVISKKLRANKKEALPSKDEMCNDNSRVGRLFPFTCCLCNGFPLLFQ